MNRVYFEFDGIKYTRSGHFGCQLESIEWFWNKQEPNADRVLHIFPDTIIELNVFTSKRINLFKVRNTWRIPSFGLTVSEYQSKIDNLIKL